MKILCVIDSLGSGGAQRQLVNLSKAFKEKGHDVSFLVYHPDDFYKKELEKADISITYILERNYLKRLLKIRSYIRRGGFDAVLSFLEAANFIATVSGFPYRKWKLVVGERSANPNILKSFKLRFYRWFHLFADYVVANSHANLDIVKKINPLLLKQKCKVIYNIVDLEPHNFSNADMTKVNTTIIIPASYRDVKNIDGLIEGVILLDNHYKEKLVINWFGNKKIDDKMTSYKKASNKIHDYNLDNIIVLHDVSNKIIEEYVKSDFVALLSHFEGFPNAICEAMMIGRPVIASRVSDLPKIIIEDENGFLCDSNDPTTIKRAIEKAIDSTEKKRKEIGLNNIKKGRLLFNKEDVVNKYLHLLN